MIDAEEQVVLVDAADRELGAMDKLEAHRKGALHRAISIFVFDVEGRLILQQRALGKYHCGGKWANTCCSHPRPGEDSETAAHRRLAEELGFDCPLTFRTKILYETDVGHGLIEHELVHAYIGVYRGAVAPHPAEVAAWRSVAPDQLAEEIRAEPSQFAPWLRIYMRDHADVLFSERRRA